MLVAFFLKLFILFTKSGTLKIIIFFSIWILDVLKSFPDISSGLVLLFFGVFCFGGGGGVFVWFILGGFFLFWAVLFFWVVGFFFSVCLDWFWFWLGFFCESVTLFLINFAWLFVGLSYVCFRYVS